MTEQFSQTPYTKSIAGLKPRPTYMEVVDYIERDPDRIQYPDRRASIMRNSFELTQLDGLGQLDLDKSDHYIQQNRQKEFLLTQFATSYGIPLAEIRAYTQSLGLYPVPSPAHFPHGGGGGGGGGGLPHGGGGGGDGEGGGGGGDGHLIPALPGPLPVVPTAPHHAHGAVAPPIVPPAAAPLAPPVAPPVGASVASAAASGLPSGTTTVAPTSLPGDLEPSSAHRVALGGAYLADLIIGLSSNVVGTTAGVVGPLAMSAAVGTAKGVFYAGKFAVKTAIKAGQRRSEIASASTDPVVYRPDGSDPNMPPTSIGTRVQPAVGTDGSTPVLLPTKNPGESKPQGFKEDIPSRPASRAPSHTSSSHRVVQLGAATHHVQDGDLLVDESGVVLLSEAALAHHNHLHNHPTHPSLAAPVEGMAADYARSVAEMSAAHESQLQEQTATAQREAVAHSARGNLAASSHGDVMVARAGMLGSILNLAGIRRRPDHYQMSPAPSDAASRRVSSTKSYEIHREGPITNPDAPHGLGTPLGSAVPSSSSQSSSSVSRVSTIKSSPTPTEIASGSGAPSVQGAALPPGFSARSSARSAPGSGRSSRITGLAGSIRSSKSSTN